METGKILVRGFEANRAHLRGVAYRMLGSRSEAEDAVQEAWLRLGRFEADDIANLRGWLTTVVARICLDMLRSRKARREDPIEDDGGGSVETLAGDDDPEREIAMADAVGAALLVVLETLQPAERVAFVLHDMFDLPFEDIAPIVGRTAVAARQLASRARRRVQARPASVSADRERRRAIVDAFLAASREGDFQSLMSLLAPDVVLRADEAAMRLGSPAEIRGAAAVAGMFKGRARAARPALIGGEVGLVVALQGRLRIALSISIDDGRITAIDAVADPERLAALDPQILP